MFLQIPLRCLILAAALAIVIVGCDKSAVAAAPAEEHVSHPLVGRWIAADDVSFSCRTASFEFRDDGSLVEGDGGQTQTYDGTLSAIGMSGDYRWSSHLRAIDGTPQCEGVAPTKGSPMQFHARLVHGGMDLALCESESMESCHLTLSRAPDHPARAARADDLGLAEPLGRAIEQASSSTAPHVVIGQADAAAPLFVVGEQLVPLQCEHLAAWNVYAESLLGTVGGAKCADATRATQLADGALADPKLAALLAKGAAQLPALSLTRETTADGSTLSYFPVLATGHGVVVLWTAVLVDKSQTSAVVVQATTTQGCPAVPVATTPRFCRDPKGLVMGIARALAVSTASLR